MKLNEIENAIRIELADIAVAVYSDDEIYSALDRATALLSRMIPKHDIAELFIPKDVTGETLTIASNKGTLAQKPIKYNSETIKAGDGSVKKRGTDYHFNYLTGEVTEIDSNLPDADYTVDYSMDDNMLDITSIKPIKLEQIEYPIPATYPAWRYYDGLLKIVERDVSLSGGERLRVYYLNRYFPPTLAEDGTYPEHLNTPVIIGSSGLAMISKAGKYILDAIALDVPNVPDLPTAPNAPTDTPPSAPSLDYTKADAALCNAETEISNADAFLTSGEVKIDEITAGDRVGQTYGDYAGMALTAARDYITEAAQYLDRNNQALNKYNRELDEFTAILNKFGNEVNLYNSEASSKLNKYNSEFNRWNARVTALVNFSDRLKSKGIERLNEFYSLIGYKAEAETLLASR